VAANLGNVPAYDKCLFSPTPAKTCRGVSQEWRGKDLPLIAKYPASRYRTLPAGIIPVSQGEHCCVATARLARRLIGLEKNLLTCRSAAAVAHNFVERRSASAWRREILCPGMQVFDIPGKMSV
jgi:hypothetical protein